MKKWLTILVAVGILVTALVATNAFAHEPDETTPPPYGTWEEMHEYCQGAGGMMGGWGMMGGFHGSSADPVTLERVASVLNLTYDELTARLTGGETLAEIAQAQGVDTTLVVDAILEPHNEMIQSRVEYGYLSEEQAQAIQEQVRERIEQVIQQPANGSYGTTGTPGAGYAPRYGGGSWGGHGGMMGGGTTGGGMMGRSGMW